MYRGSGAGQLLDAAHLRVVAEKLTIDSLRELVQFALVAADGLGLTSAGIWLDRAVVALEDQAIDAPDRPG